MDFGINGPKVGTPIESVKKKKKEEQRRAVSFFLCVGCGRIKNMEKCKKTIKNYQIILATTGKIKITQQRSCLEMNSQKTNTEVKIMARNSSNRANVPEAKEWLNQMKYEIANEHGINLKEGYNGDLTAKENGTVGGYMVKKMIEQYQGK